MNEELRQTLIEQIDSLLTVGEMAKAFGVSGQSIRLWVAERNLPCIKLKGDERNVLRFIPTEVKAWAKENEQPVVKGIYGKMRKDYD